MRFTRLTGWEMTNSTTNNMNCTYISPADNSTNSSSVCENNESMGMPLTEIFTIFITTILGLTGVFLNIGILVIIVQKRLIKKDYRMLYYMFMTCGDLLFAINCAFVGINIAFKEVYIFKLVSVCLTLMIVMGLVAYQWTAICIILLIIDLIWTIKHPFSSNRNLKRFSKIGCVGAFFIGICNAVGPFLFWNDIPFELPFCSIANVYGSHIEFFLIEAVSVCSLLLVIMVAVSFILLHEIYRSHIVHSEDKNIPTVNTGDIFVVDTGPSNHKDEEKDQKHGQENDAYITDVTEEDFKRDNSVKRTSNDKRNARNKKYNSASDSRREVRRTEFLRSCRTVAIFMSAYIGCLTPYVILSGLGIGCGDNCNESPESRVVRALVATALYLLPIIDPILYTKRFDVFKEASLGVLKQWCRGRENSDTVVETY